MASLFDIIDLRPNTGQDGYGKILGGSFNSHYKFQSLQRLCFLLFLSSLLTAPAITTLKFLSVSLEGHASMGI